MKLFVNILIIILLYYIYYFFIKKITHYCQALCSCSNVQFLFQYLFVTVFLTSFNLIYLFNCHVCCYLIKQIPLRNSKVLMFFFFFFSGGGGGHHKAFVLRAPKWLATALCGCTYESVHVGTRNYFRPCEDFVHEGIMSGLSCYFVLIFLTRWIF